MDEESSPVIPIVALIVLVRYVLLPPERRTAHESTLAYAAGIVLLVLVPVAAWFVLRPAPPRLSAAVLGKQYPNTLFDVTIPDDGLYDHTFPACGPGFMVHCDTTGDSPDFTIRIDTDYTWNSTTATYDHATAAIDCTGPSTTVWVQGSCAAGDGQCTIDIPDGPSQARIVIADVPQRPDWPVIDLAAS